MSRLARRHFLAAIAGGVASIGAGALARPPAGKRIGWMSAGSSDNPEVILEVTRAFRALGYPQGEPGIVVLFAEGRRERLDAIASELVAMKVDVLFSGATAGTHAALRATRHIPIVFAGVADPVGSGFVKALARPGGNVTGVSNFGLDSAAKLLELLREVKPAARRVGVLASDNPGMVAVIEAMREPARRLGYELHVERPSDLPRIESAFGTFARIRVEALVVISDTPTALHRKRVAQLAADAKLPAIYSYAVHVEDGGLMSYGPDPLNLVPQVVDFMDRILKGTPPGELAVQGPREFELVLNLDAARALGLVFPPGIVLRANRIVGKRQGGP